MPSTANIIEFASHAIPRAEGRPTEMNPIAIILSSDQPREPRADRRVTSEMHKRSISKTEPSDFQPRLFDHKKPSTISGRLRLGIL